MILKTDSHIKGTRENNFISGIDRKTIQSVYRIQGQSDCRDCGSHRGSKGDLAYNPKIPEEGKRKNYTAISNYSPSEHL